MIIKSLVSKRTLRIGLIAIAVICVVSGDLVFADSLRVEPSASEIEQHENVSLDYIISSDSMSAKVGDPSFQSSDFDEVNVYQRGTSIQSVYENGNFSVKRTETITVVLHPKKVGDLKVKELKILVNGKLLTHPDVTIKVFQDGKLPTSSSRGNVFGGLTRQNRGLQAPLPKSGLGTARQDITRSILLKTEPDKLKVYKGQLIRLKYNMYTRAQLANMQVERFPTATGFLKEDIDVPILKGLQNLDWSRAVLGGVEYRKGTLAEYALFPVREGQLPLDVFSAKVSFRGRAGMGGLDDDGNDPLNLNRFFQAFQLLTETIESDRRSIEVLPLPTEGQPVDFSGLVGTFSVDLQIDKTSVKTGEPLQVKICIAGEGHAGSLEKLQVPWPESFELYEDRSSTKFDVSGRSERVFEYLVIPRKAGKFTIPEVNVWMFDPENRSYVNKHTTSVEVDVEQGVGTSDALVLQKGNRIAEGANTPKVEMAKPFLANEITHSEKVIASKTSLLKNWIRVICLVLLIISALVLLAKPEKLLEWRQRAKSKKRNSIDRRLGVLQGLIDKQDNVGFLTCLDSELTKVIHERYGLTRGSMTTVELTDGLSEKGASKEITQRVKSLSDRLDNMRYASDTTSLSNESLKELFEELKYIVEAK